MPSQPSPKFRSRCTARRNRAGSRPSGTGRCRAGHAAGEPAAGIRAGAARAGTPDSAGTRHDPVHRRRGAHRSDHRARSLSLSDPEGTRVLEQNFQFDLVSTEKLLLEIHRPADHGGARGADGVTPITGTLLSANDGLVLRGNGRVRSTRCANGATVRFPRSAGRPQSRARRSCGTCSRPRAGRRTRASPTRPAASPGGRTTT